MPEEPNPVSDTADVPAATLGARIQRLRLQQGLSVRDVAIKAGVDKNTVVRLEKGLPTSARTRDRIGLVLGSYISRLTLPEPDTQEMVAHHVRKKETWWPYPDMGEARPLGEQTEGDSDALMARGLVASLACRLPRGRLQSSLLKLREETPINAHVGEEFLFCLRGTVKLTVSGKETVLHEGDAVTFWCAEPHTYAPANGPLSPDAPPVLLLAVWLDAREERK